MDCNEEDLQIPENKSKHHTNGEETADDQLVEEHSVEESDKTDVEKEGGTRLVDDDEDKKNPQYIPKKGMFYEHDDRKADEEDDDVSEDSLTKPREPLRRTLIEAKERWNHDRFNNNEQAPKSKAELVSIYGYDIRNEDGPPKARRRRRYGRGPSKYTRSWEDENAYNKIVPPVRQKRGNPVNASVQILNSTSIRAEGINALNEHTEKVTVEPSIVVPSTSNEVLQPNPTPTAGNTTFGSIHVSEVRGLTTRMRNYRGLNNTKTVKDPIKTVSKKDFVRTQNYANQTLSIVNGISNLHIEQPKAAHRVYTNTLPTAPSLSIEVHKGSSKRYSSIRQRALPETIPPPSPPLQTAPSQPPPPQPIPPSAFSAVTSSYATHPGFYTNAVDFGQAAHLIGPPPQTIPVTSQQLLQAQSFAAPPPPSAHYATAPPSAPTFVPAGPSQYAQASPAIINYIASDTLQFAAPNFHPSFQPQTFTPIVGPPSGITYYSTDQQLTQPRPAVPVKRPKAAIPIVAPPTVNEICEANVPSGVQYVHVGNDNQIELDVMTVPHYTSGEEQHLGVQTENEQPCVN